MRIINIVILAVVVGGAAWFMFGDKQPQAADLGVVLDRTSYSMERYDAYLKQEGVTNPGEKELETLTRYMEEDLNVAPPLHPSPIGVDLAKDASLVGYVDANVNGAQDDGEERLFTVEVDEANQRLIATDVSGNSTHSGFSGTGLLAGVLIGSMLSRQRAAGVTAASFNNRTTTPRSSYRAPASARTRSRSGGLAGGK